MSYYNIGDKAHTLAWRPAVILDAMIFSLPQLATFGMGLCLAPHGKSDVARMLK